jgi:hypothetical protein
MALIEVPKEDAWALAAKIGGVLALAGAFLRWLLTPMFVTATRKALEPELSAIAKAGERFATGDIRFTAIERNMAALQDDVRQIRERVDDIADGHR